MDTAVRQCWMPWNLVWGTGNGLSRRLSVQKEEHMEKSEQISVGVVGTGGMGGLHAGILQTEVANARLAAVADLNRERAGKVAERSGAYVFGDAVAMIQDENVDAVVI